MWYRAEIRLPWKVNTLTVKLRSKPMANVRRTRYFVFLIGVIDICSNFSFGQSAEEDEAIVNVLLAMQQESGPDHADSEDRGSNDSDGYNTLDENGEEENISKWSNQNDEIGDILASQRVVEKHLASQAPTLPENNGWWSVAEHESRPISIPLRDLGSSRVVLRHSQKVWKLLV